MAKVLDLTVNTTKPSDNLLVLRDLTFGYEPDRPVITHICGQLEPGRLCTLIGPNAAGKTTLLRLMLGQLRPWSGGVWLSETDVRVMKPRRRAALVSYVPQRSSLSFAFTVEQVVTLGRHALTRNEAAVDQAIVSCDLAGLRQRVYATLSAGQQQRVSLARAIAQSSGSGVTMLLDEPVSALDLWHVHRTMRLLVDLAHSGMSVIVVLHDLNLAARYADDVWLLHEGRLQAGGPWDQVLQPEVLQPVYRVGLRSLSRQASGRPVFIVESNDTM